MGKKWVWRQWNQSGTYYHSLGRSQGWSGLQLRWRRWQGEDWCKRRLEGKVKETCRMIGWGVWKGMCPAWSQISPLGDEVANGVNSQREQWEDVKDLAGGKYKFNFKSNQFQLLMDICGENVDCSIRNEFFPQEFGELKYRYKMRWRWR